MSSNKQTKFNKEWITNPAFSSWVGVDPYSDTKARCMLCGYSFELGNMGKQSLVSHANGKKHKVKAQLSVKVKQEIKPIDLHFDKVVPSTSVKTMIHHLTVLSRMIHHLPMLTNQLIQQNLLFHLHHLCLQQRRPQPLVCWQSMLYGMKF